MLINTSRLTPPHGTPLKPTAAPMPKCPPPKQTDEINPFDVRSVTLTVLEWRYILHVLRVCQFNQDGTEEAEMNEHSQREIEKACK